MSALAASLQSAWIAALAAIQALSFFPPPALDAAAFEEVAAQATARRRIQGEAAQGLDRVAALGLIPAPPAAVWLAITDDHPEQSFSGLTEAVFEGAWASPKLLYGYLDLPWPFQDRQWMLRIRNNRALALEAGVWERYWTLDAASLERARAAMGAKLDEALLTPRNEGHWLLLPFQGQTLALYQSRVSLGGVVPDDAVESWAMSGLNEIFSDAAANAARMKTHYGPGCAPQPDPSGALIPCF